MVDCFIHPKNKKLLIRFLAGFYKSLKRMALILVITGIAFPQRQNLSSHPEVGPDTVLAREILDAHNAVRAELKLPLLQWSNELADLSQKWANTLLIQNRFYINPTTPYGQNLFMVTGGSASPAAVVRQWASESQSYDYDSNTCSGICGHYTQLVWKRTSKVGCAVARSSDREVWVCDYDPAGNVLGQLPY